MGDFGFSICYDLRFPELYRELAFRGAKLIFVPAAFTMYTGKDHWESLLRARAIENQVYIAAPNQIGEHPDNKICYGNSMIIDPWGKIIARASDKVEAFVADIDWDYLEDIRKKLPSLKNRVDLQDM
jgi:predicted amidohydrolase